MWIYIKGDANLSLTAISWGTPQLQFMSISGPSDGIRILSPCIHSLCAEKRDVLWCTVMYGEQWVHYSTSRGQTIVCERHSHRTF